MIFLNGKIVNNLAFFDNFLLNMDRHPDFVLIFPPIFFRFVLNVTRILPEFFAINNPVTGSSGEVCYIYRV